MYENDDIKLAKKKLEEGGLACVVVRDGEILFTSRNRGISPLVEFNGISDDRGGYSLADKVIGRAAAFLCIYSNIEFVYAVVISSPAMRILEKNGVPVTFNIEVTAIKNRTGDGLCPLEKLSAGVEDPGTMFDKVVDWLDSLKLSD
jgi:hypothetical protein